MPKPHEFSSEEELIKFPKDSKTIKAATCFFSKRYSDVSTVVLEGVAPNTYRAFRNLPVKPSITFRMWAIDYLNNSLHFLRTVSDSQSYAEYVHKATEDLCREWKRQTNSEIGYGRGAKLFNLVLKKLACLSSLSEAQRTTLICLQHIPLDSYTIIGLRKVAHKLKIPVGATMRYVDTQERYIQFQNIIRSITNNAGIPAIYYDLLAWDMAHRSSTSSA